MCPMNTGTGLGVKLEYIFDNTRSLGMNLYTGTRYKIFAEVQEQVYKEPV